MNVQTQGSEGAVSKYPLHLDVCVSVLHCTPVRICAHTHTHAHAHSAGQSDFEITLVPAHTFPSVHGRGGFVGSASGRFTRLFPRSTLTTSRALCSVSCPWLQVPGASGLRQERSLPTPDTHARQAVTGRLRGDTYSARLNSLPD